MKVLVLWADSRSANLGVQVLAFGMKALAQRAWGEDVEVDFQDYGPGDSDIGFGNRSILKDLGRRDGILKRKLRQYDVLIDSGAGDSFADIYGFPRLAWMFNAQRLAKGLKIPVVIGPQTIGPFDHWWGRLMARRMMRTAAQVHTRDTRSADFARTTLRIPVDVTSTDVVFALDRPEVERSRDVLLNVSGLLWQENPHVPHEQYRRVIGELIRGLTDAGRTVTLLSHVIENPRPDNDVPVCREVSAEFGLEVLVPTNLAEAREMIASSSLVIGSRMHACLNALSQGTPALPLAYSRKFAPLMEDLGWRHGFDLRTENLDAAAVVRAAVELAEGAHRDDLSTTLDTAHERLQRSVDAMARWRR